MSSVSREITNPQTAVRVSTLFEINTNLYFTATVSAIAQLALEKGGKFVLTLLDLEIWKEDICFEPPQSHLAKQETGSGSAVLTEVVFSASHSVMTRT